MPIRLGYARLRFLLPLLPLLASQLAAAQKVRIGVLGLFKPRQLTVSVFAGNPVIVRAGEKDFMLQAAPGRSTAVLQISGNRVIVEQRGEAVRAPVISAVSQGEDEVDFVLSVPGKISRHYRGRLEVSAGNGFLVPVVRMELEVAVASAVQAESPPGAPLEALKAQAVATRSYLFAGKGRHLNFDFCDTTHCQFLRAPAPAESAAFRAAADTRSLVLAYREIPFAAMFTRSCSGRTRTPEELGMKVRGYPYFPVACAYCRSHPAGWSRQVSSQEAGELVESGELARLQLDRRLGWAAVPSNNFTVRRQGREILLEGTGQGHGIGLCQQGAAAMARAGAGFRTILNHYYPNTEIIPAVPQRVPTF